MPSSHPLGLCENIWTVEQPSSLARSMPLSMPPAIEICTPSLRSMVCMITKSPTGALAKEFNMRGIMLQERHRAFPECRFFANMKPQTAGTCSCSAEVLDQSKNLSGSERQHHLSPREGLMSSAVNKHRQAAHADIFLFSFMETGQEHPIFIGNITDKTLCHTIIPPAR